jgi:hypothetical protein
MSERRDGADGLGRSSEGTPDFELPTVAVPPPPAPPPPPPPRRVGAPGPSRGPAVVTAVVVLLVAAAAAFGTLAAWRADTQLSTPPATTSYPAPSTADPDQNTILFSSAHGAGRLTVRDHTWETGSPDRLRLEVELSCASGTVDHGPDSFLLYDADGNVVEPSPVGGPGSIDDGTLGPGEQVRGNVVFDVSRQVVTLVLSDTAGSVTALRITD